MSSVIARADGFSAGLHTLPPLRLAPLVCYKFSEDVPSEPLILLGFLAGLIKGLVSWRPSQQHLSSDQTQGRYLGKLSVESRCFKLTIPVRNGLPCMANDRVNNVRR
jgi:hypothetical protein